jgi:hypothetical protein
VGPAGCDLRNHQFASLRQTQTHRGLPLLASVLRRALLIMRWTASVHFHCDGLPHRGHMCAPLYRRSSLNETALIVAYYDMFLRSRATRRRLPGEFCVFLLR